MVVVPDNRVVVEDSEAAELDWARLGAMVRERAMTACERAVVESGSQAEGVNR